MERPADLNNEWISGLSVTENSPLLDREEKKPWTM